VLRGGAWGNNHDWIWHYMAEYYSNYYVLSAARYYEGLLPAEAVSFAGFRCARSQ
jgi:hypothetical protein